MHRDSRLVYRPVAARLTSALCMTKYLDVVNARIVGKAVVFNDIQAQRVGGRRRAAAGFFAHKNLSNDSLGTNPGVAERAHHTQ